jgi:RNA-directed DNA polymerase
MRREESDLLIRPVKPGNAGGGKEQTVNGEMMQLELDFGTAESPSRGPAGVERDLSLPAKEGLPQPKFKDRGALSALTMEAVTKESNLLAAFREVARNRGAHGIDARGIEDVRADLASIVREVSCQLLEGTYRPQEVRRVWIPKGNGGKRGLGIPTVVDRMVQQAVLRVLQPVIDPNFDPSSHGFRPTRSCQTAIAEAKSYVEAGYSWVVDIDLEKFFDRVNHQRLMASLERWVRDKRIRALILRMLRSSVVLPDGVVIETKEGTPQGGPLSPLLSNIVLNELDEELRRRGHRFVRYADDCNIYVRSKRAGERVLKSISCYLEKRMRLRINGSKSTVAEPQERHFLGFRIVLNPWDMTVKIGLSQRTRKRMAQRVGALTPRNLGCRLSDGIGELNSYLKGWIGFFRVCETDNVFLRMTDAHIRRRLRAIQLKQWKNKRIRCKQLAKLGASKQSSGRSVYGQSRSLWALSIQPAVHRSVSNAYFASLGLVSLWEEWKRYHQCVSIQMQLFE